MKRFLFAGEGFDMLRTPSSMMLIFFLLLMGSSCGTLKKPEFYDPIPTIIGKYELGDKLPADFTIGYDPFDSIKIVRLSDYKGKAVIIDVWATWCGACISKFPIMDSLSNHYRGQLEVVMVGMLGRDTPEKIREFIKDYRLKHEKINLTFLIEDNLHQSFTFRSLPHYIWIDPNRRIRAFTDHKSFKEEHLTRLIGGMPVYLPVKLR